jgi:kynurenine formamidase
MATMSMAQPMSLETYRGIIGQISNWGRWGADDELGALNFITREKRIRSASLVRDGGTVGISDYLITTFSNPELPKAATHLMTGTYDFQAGARVAYVEDYLAIAPHGHDFTHIDALCHMAFEGKVFNGKAGDAVFNSRGGLQMGIDVTRDGIVSRGVLLDIPRVRGVEWIEPGDCAYVEDLERAEQSAGLKVESGDILFVRTGRFRRQATMGRWITRDAMPGLHATTLPWFYQREVAVHACDTSSEVYPEPVEGVRNPMHIGLLTTMGIHMIDAAYLEDLSEACAQRNRWEFMVVIAPLKLKGGTGLAINPIAIF